MNRVFPQEDNLYVVEVYPMLREARQGIVAAGVAALTIGLFIFDLHTPLGLANHVLYIGPVLLALLSPHKWFPLVVASLVTLLTGVGAVLSPSSYDIPLWFSVANRAFSIVVFWTPVWYFVKRRQHEEQLQRLNEELEMRVQARTRELAAVNASLVAEVSERMQTEQSLEASRRELKQLAAQLLRVQEEERRRISRDLHDDVNQRLALLAMEIEGIDRDLSPTALHARSALRDVHDRIAELSEDVRHLAYQYHPSVLDDLGLPIAMQRLVDDFVARTNIQGTLVCRNIPKHLPQHVATCLYRVAQESLNNVMRHAKASHVDVEFACSNQDLTLTIADNGAGFASEPSRNGTDGLGLLSMKERITGVDGTLHIESAVGKGTQVKAIVRLEEEV